MVSLLQEAADTEAAVAEDAKMSLQSRRLDHDRDADDAGNKVHKIEFSKYSTEDTWQNASRSRHTGDEIERQSRGKQPSNPPSVSWFDASAEGSAWAQEFLDALDMDDRRAKANATDER